jgi:hypothetical protein
MTARKDVMIVKTEGRIVKTTDKKDVATARTIDKPADRNVRTTDEELNHHLQ